MRLQSKERNKVLVPRTRVSSRPIRFCLPAFSSTENLGSVDIRVTPSLRRFLSLSPSHLDVVQKNTQITISIVCNIEEDATPRTHAGRIVLRAKKDHSDEESSHDDSSDEDSGGIRNFLPISLDVLKPTATSISDGKTPFSSAVCQEILMGN